MSAAEDAFGKACALISVDAPPSSCAPSSLPGTVSSSVAWRTDWSRDGKSVELAEEPFLASTAGEGEMRMISVAIQSARRQYRQSTGLLASSH